MRRHSARYHRLTFLQGLFHGSHQLFSPIAGEYFLQRAAGGILFVEEQRIARVIGFNQQLRTFGDNDVVRELFDCIANASTRGFEFAGRLLQLIRSRRQLVIRRLQFFVGRLNFFVICLQFFIGRLQLFVGRLELFVGRLQLFLGQHQLFVGRL